MFYGDLGSSKAITALVMFAPCLCLPSFSKSQEKGHSEEWPGERLAIHPYLLTSSISHHF
ncbi:MAG: hypothetical protein TH68_01950 [Candidatus Synechococcus spongiarum 142]|uniref:Uncharacterized protein n=1 Tax=Candidatus Synechococcus spongiarum 142 TaxID=1608213 RepID=A0A6N3X6D5_9SYNE|nr:MAG: hypothetical protein TH68_01950 [Candidatus Synechococcus spongiarum 142]